MIITWKKGMMKMQKSYIRINWENYPSDATPINETNMNKIDYSLNEVDNRVIEHETTKATKEEVATLVADVTFEESTGIITVTKKNGAVITIDTKMEKIAVNFDYNRETQQIILTLIDGTKQYIDLSDLITQYEFLNSDTVTFIVMADGSVKAEVLDGSITEDKLQPNYLAQIKVEVAKVELSASSAEKSEINAKSSEDNAKTSETNAKLSEENAKLSETNAEDYKYSAYNSAISAMQAKDDAVSLVADVTEKIESGYFKGDKGDTGEQGPKGDTGEQGTKGEKGDTGESGIVTPVNGFFTLSVDSEGNLWAYSAGDGTTLDFEYDSETGNLYVVQEVS